LKHTQQLPALPVAESAEGGAARAPEEYSGSSARPRDVGTWRHAGFVGVALVAHALLWAVMPLVHRPPLPRIAERTTEIEIETPPAEGPHLPAHGGAAPRTETAVRGALGTATVTVTVTTTSATTTATGEPGAAAPLDSAAASQPLPSILTQNTEIGLDGTSSFRVDVAKNLPDANAIVAENVRHAIMDPIRAHEQQNGDLTSGPLAVALEQTTRRTNGTPFEGSAVFSIEVDDLGLVVHVDVSQASGNQSAWREVARSVLNAFAQKRLHVPPGAKKVAMQIQITSKVALPSGARHPMHVGAPAVEALDRMAHGQFDKAPDNGTGSVPIVGGTFDLADIGSHPQRVVGARVLSQETF
jgi:hypothetical protein